MYKSILVIVLYLCIKDIEASQKFVKFPNFRENDSYIKMEDWPCPLSSEIEPCQCYVSDDFKIRIVCDGVVKLDEITRIFSVHFPFNTLEGIFFTVTKDSDVAILKLSTPLTFNAHVRPACLPPNEDFYPENVEGNVTGIVSGWGLLKDSNSSSLLMSTGFWNSN